MLHHIQIGKPQHSDSEALQIFRALCIVQLSRRFMVDYDDTGSIGKRYRRQDEIGTPFCITLDFETVGDPDKGIEADRCVTIRERDTMEQVRLPIDQVGRRTCSMVRLPIDQVADYIAARVDF